MQGILGKKIGMTHIYREREQVSVTVIEAGPLHVVQRKLKERDGYDAVQLGFGLKKESRVNKPMVGHFKKHGAKPVYHLKEFRFVGGQGEGEGEGCEIKAGDTLGPADVLKAGDFVDVTATSKGRGFTGVVKRWNFKGGPGGHGSKHGKTGGAIGQGSDPSRVFKGMKMAGQKGNKHTTVQNVEVLDIKAEDNILVLKGSLPGPKGALLVIKKSVKKG